jgi:hypothetical protein
MHLFFVSWTGIKAFFQCKYSGEEVFNLALDGNDSLQIGLSNKNFWQQTVSKLCNQRKRQIGRL